MSDHTHVCVTDKSVIAYRMTHIARLTMSYQWMKKAREVSASNIYYIKSRLVRLLHDDKVFLR